MKWRRDRDRFIFLAVSCPNITDSERGEPQALLERQAFPWGGELDLQGPQALTTLGGAGGLLMSIFLANQ